MLRENERIGPSHSNSHHIQRLDSRIIVQQAHEDSLMRFLLSGTFAVVVGLIIVCSAGFGIAAETLAKMPKGEAGHLNRTIRSRNVSALG